MAMVYRKSPYIRRVFLFHQRGNQDELKNDTIMIKWCTNIFLKNYIQTDPKNFFGRDLEMENKMNECNWIFTNCLQRVIRSIDVITTRKVKGITIMSYGDSTSLQMKT